MSVYTITFDPSADEASDNYGYMNEILDGDFAEAFPIDIVFHPVMKAFRLDNGLWVEQSAAYQGLPIDMSGLPKRIRWGGGKRDLGDFQKMASHFLVSVKLRDLIEELEPGVHQFQPIELIWKKDESHAADFFWFNPCNRVDGIDRTHSTAKFDEKTGKWKYEGGEFVVNLEQVAGHHIWVDSRASFGTNWVSEAFYNAAHQAGIKGIKFTIQKVI